MNGWGPKADELDIVPERRPNLANRVQGRTPRRADLVRRLALACSLVCGVVALGLVVPPARAALPDPSPRPAPDPSLSPAPHPAAMRLGLGGHAWNSNPEEGPGDRRELRGKMLPSLVRIRELRVAFQSGAFEISGRHYDGPVALQVTGILTHPFQSSIHDARVQLAFLPQGKLDPTWRILRASPLELTDLELAQNFPRPWLSWERPAYRKRTVAPNEEPDVLLETEYDQLLVDLHHLPEYMGMISGYVLEDPSTSDLLKIIHEGGVPDHAAAADWAKTSELDYTRFDPESRKEVMDAIIHDLQKARAPLAHGDLMRLHALMSLTRIFASPEELEPLLQLERSMDVLLTSVSLSYYEAVDDENWIDLPVHSIRRVPSLLEYLDAYNTALVNIRRVSFPRLLELSFDPLDFRDAPEDGELKESKVQKQAKKLLEPLQPTNVGGIIRASDQDLEIQREIWKFYIKAKYAPAVVPMMHWLQEHPYELEEVGIPAARSLGRSIVPSILSHYFEPKGPHIRQVSRDMLLALPDDAVEDVLRAIRGFGILLGRESSLKSALEAFETREKMIHRRQADHLEQAALGPESANHSFSRRMRDLEQLGHLDPKRLEERSEEVVRLLAKAALDLSEVSHSESKRAMRLMEDLPLGQASLEALEELTLVQARIAYKQQDLEKAREVLINFDPSLQNLKIRRMWGDLSHEWAQAGIETGQFAQASWAIAEAKEKLPEDPRFGLLANDLYFAKNRIGLALASLVALIVVVSLAVLLAKLLVALGRALRGRFVRIKRGKAAASASRMKPDAPPTLEKTEQFDSDHLAAMQEQIAEQNMLQDQDREVMHTENPAEDDDESDTNEDDPKQSQNQDLQSSDVPEQVEESEAASASDLDGESSEPSEEPPQQATDQEADLEEQDPKAADPRDTSLQDDEENKGEEDLDDEFDRMLDAQTIPPGAKVTPPDAKASAGTATVEDDGEELDFEDASGQQPHQATSASPVSPLESADFGPDDDDLDFESEQAADKDNKNAA